MNEILNELVKEKTGFKFITKEEAEKEQKTTAKISSIDDINFDRSTRKLRAEFTFDNFVVGESNRFAFVTAMKVAESPYAVLNPLYISSKKVSFLLVFLGFEFESINLAFLSFSNLK